MNARILLSVREKLLHIHVYHFACFRKFKLVLWGQITKDTARLAQLIISLG